MNDQTRNPNSRRDRIPWWINALSVVIALILAFQSYSAYVDPSLAYGAFDMSGAANQQAMATLGGRNVVMLVVTLAALRSQNAMFLAMTFLMHFTREAQDMFIVPWFAGFTTVAGLAQMFTFLFIFVIPEFLALRKLRRIAAEPAAAA